MTNPPLGISLLVGSQALSYIRQWRSAFGIALKLTASVNEHGAFPKIDRWSSGSHLRERTLRLVLRPLGDFVSFFISKCSDNNHDEIN